MNIHDDPGNLGNLIIPIIPKRGKALIFAQLHDIMWQFWPVCCGIKKPGVLPGSFFILRLFDIFSIFLLPFQHIVHLCNVRIPSFRRPVFLKHDLCLIGNLSCIGRDHLCRSNPNGQKRKFRKLWRQRIRGLTTWFAKRFRFRQRLNN
jgi:hypothetical protein